MAIDDQRTRVFVEIELFDDRHPCEVQDEIYKLLNENGFEVMTCSGKGIYGMEKP